MRLAPSVRRKPSATPASSSALPLALPRCNGIASEPIVAASGPAADSQPATRREMREQPAAQQNEHDGSARIVAEPLWQKHDAAVAEQNGHDSSAASSLHKNYGSTDAALEPQVGVDLAQLTGDDSLGSDAPQVESGIDTAFQQHGQSGSGKPFDQQTGHDSGTSVAEQNGHASDAAPAERAGQDSAAAIARQLVHNSIAAVLQDVHDGDVPLARLHGHGVDAALTAQDEAQDAPACVGPSDQHFRNDSAPADLSERPQRPDLNLLPPDAPYTDMHAAEKLPRSKAERRQIRELKRKRLAAAMATGISQTLHVCRCCCALS